MASTAKLLTEAELGRLRACADENTALANCWNKPHVAVIAMEWAPLGFIYAWRGWIARNENMGYWQREGEMPVLTVEVAEFSTQSASPRFRRYTFWIRSRIALWGNSRWWTQRSADEVLDHKVFFEPADITLSKVNKLLVELTKEFPSLCICSHRPGQTMSALEKMGFRLPKNAVFVDLVKVLDHQSRASGVPKELKAYVDARIYVNPRSGGRFEERPEVTEGDDRFLGFLESAPKWGKDREWLEVIRRPEDVSAPTVLAVVGPNAALHRRDMERVEKDNTALDKIAKAAARDRRRK